MNSAAPLKKPIVTLTIPGRPIVKKNTKRVYGSGRSKRVVYTDRYRAWHLEAKRLAAFCFKGALVECLVEAHYRFYFTNRRGEADVSNLCEAPGDLLKDAGVLKDDRLIVRIEAQKYFGHDPRTEIEIYKYEPKEQA